MDAPEGLQQSASEMRILLRGGSPDCVQKERGQANVVVGAVAFWRFGNSQSFQFLRLGFFVAHLSQFRYFLLESRCCDPATAH